MATIDLGDLLQWLLDHQRPQPEPSVVAMEVTISPSGAPSTVVLDDGTMAERSRMVNPLPGRDARWERYDVAPQHAQTEAELTVEADGYVTQVQTFHFRDGVIVLPEVVLERTVPEPPTSPLEVYGNFLAAPGFSLGVPGQIPGLMYGAMTPEQRASYRAMCRAEGYHTLPIGPYARYHYPGGTWAYDYRHDLPAYRDLLQEAIADGLQPMAQVYNYHPDVDPPWTVDAAKRYADDTLAPVLDCYPGGICYGLEANDFGQPTRIDEGHPEEFEHGTGINASDEVIPLGAHLRQIIGPERTLWFHLCPNWWAPLPRKMGTMDEWSFWQHAVSFDGLLFQIHPQSSPRDASYLTFEMYPQNPSNAGGIAGRLNYLGKKCALFEFLRDFPHWTSVQQWMARHPKAPLLSGYC